MKKGKEGNRLKINVILHVQASFQIALQAVFLFVAAQLKPIGSALFMHGALSMLDRVDDGPLCVNVRGQAASSVTVNVEAIEGPQWNLCYHSVGLFRFRVRPTGPWFLWFQLILMVNQGTSFVLFSHLEALQFIV